MIHHFVMMSVVLLLLLGAQMTIVFGARLHKIEDRWVVFLGMGAIDAAAFILWGNGLAAILWGWQ